MPLSSLTEQELTRAGVSSLPITPTASPAFGGKSYTPAQMKAAFDRLPRLIAERLNAVIASLTDGEILSQIPLSLGQTPTTLAAFCDLLAAHLEASPGFDASPTEDSANVVTSGGIYAALRAQGLAYDGVTGVLSLTAGAGESAYASAAFPIPALEKQVALLRTLMGASVLVEKTEDTYSSRETAGGLPVVDNSPTTVHRIAGDTKTSVNLFDLSLEGGSAHVSGMDITTNNNTWTVSGTANASLVDFKTIILPSTLGGKTITFSQSKYFSSFGEAGAVYFVLDRNDGIRIGNTYKNKLTATLDPEYSYSLSIRCGSYVGESFEEETISFMVNEGEEAQPYSDYFAGTKSAAFQGIVSCGRNLLKPSEDLTKTIAGVTYQAMQETGTVKVTGTPNVREGTAVFKNIPLPTGTFTMYIPNKMSGVSWYLRNSTTQVASIGASTTNQFVTFTADTKELYSIYVYVEVSVGTIDYTETPMLLYGSVTENFPAFSLYSADGSFHLDTAQDLGKWDYIDADTQALVTATADADFSSVTDADGVSAGGADGTTTAGRYYWALCSEGMVAEDFTLSDIITNLPTIEDYQSLAPDENAYLSLDTETRTLLLLIPESYGENGGTWVSEHPEVYAVFKTQPLDAPMNIPATYPVWEHGLETILPESEGDASADVQCTVTASYYVKAGGDAA